MLLWFNKKGILKEQLDSYGNPPRVGSQSFQIIAYFDGLDIDINYPNADIVLQKPDFYGTKLPRMGMDRVDITFQAGDADGQSQYFEVGHTYPCFMFDFASIINQHDTPTDYTDDTHVTLLDTPGLWKTTIMLKSASGVYDVTGTATFDVEGLDGSNDEVIPSESAVIRTFIQELSRKLNIRNGIVVLYELPDNPGSSGYSDGQIFYIESENQFYKMVNNSFQLFNIFDPSQSYVTVEEEPFVIPPEER